jgi:hypothetical protein
LFSGWEAGRVRGEAQGFLGHYRHGLRNEPLYPISLWRTGIGGKIRLSRRTKATVIHRRAAYCYRLSLVLFR